MKYIVSILIISFFLSCQNKESKNICRIYTWEMNVEKADYPKVLFDTTCSDDKVYFDNYSCNKLVVDSFFIEGNVEDELLVDDLVLEMNNKSDVYFNHEKVKFAEIIVRRINSSIPINIFYCKEYGVLIKKYHARDMAVLVKIETIEGELFLNGSLLKGLTESLLADTIFFPPLSSPPLPESEIK